MTTIVFSSKTNVVAIDFREASGMSTREVDKIIRCPKGEWIACGAGIFESIKEIAAHYGSGKEIDSSRFPGDSAQMLFSSKVTDTVEAVKYGRNKETGKVEFLSSFVAGGALTILGSGGAYYAGAIYAGASPKEAAKITVRRDPATSLKFQYVDMLTFKTVKDKDFL